MASDTSFGKVRYFEDFLYDVIADAAEISVLAPGSGTCEIVAAAADGRIRLTSGGDGSDAEVAVSFGDMNWTAGVDLQMEARIVLSNLTDVRYFVGFGDTIAETSETMFDNPADVLAIGTQSDAFGLFYDNDATTKELFAVGAKTDSITVNHAIGAEYNPVAAVMTTLGCHLSADRKVACFYVDGKEVYRLDSATTLVAAVDLVPCVCVYDQGTTFNLDVDYLYGKKARASA